MLRHRASLLTTAIAVLMAMVLAACGSDPTPTPTATPRPADGSPNATPTPVPSFDADAYFGGKTIRLITGTSPGGGYDIILRIFASIAPKHFPAGTRFIVVNLPGAGQLRGLQEVMNAKPDGLTTGPTHPRWFQQALLFDNVEGFSLSTVNIIGSPTFRKTPSLYCMRSEVAGSWQEVLDKGITLTVGELAPGNSVGAEFLQELGGPVKMVYGYGGTSEIYAAFDRGEVDATSRCGPEATQFYPEWLSQNQMVPLFYDRLPEDPDHIRAMGVASGEVPYVLDLPGISATEEQRLALAGYVDLVTFQRTFVLPPGVPDDVVNYWQEAFEKIVTDDAFIAAMENANYIDEYGVGSGDEILERSAASSASRRRCWTCSARSRASSSVRPHG